MEKLSRVLEVRMTTGIQFHAEMLTSLTFEKHKAEMSLHPAGVYVQYKGLHIIIPYSNLAYARCEAPAAKDVAPMKENKERKSA